MKTTLPRTRAAKVSLRRTLGKPGVGQYLSPAMGSFTASHPNMSVS